MRFVFALPLKLMPWPYYMGDARCCAQGGKSERNRLHSLNKSPFIGAQIFFPLAERNRGLSISFLTYEY